MSGWIKLHRSLMSDPLYTEEKITKIHAFIDLCLLANHKSGHIVSNGIKYEVKSGQVGTSISTLAKRWSWSKGKVNRFLERLENELKIERVRNRPTSIISIVGYGQDQTNGTGSERKQVTNKKVRGNVWNMPQEN